MTINLITKSRFPFLLLLLLLTSTTNTLADSARWRAFYFYEGASEAEKLTQDAHGNVYVGGTVWLGESRWGVGIVKYNAHGKLLWARTFDSDLPSEPVWDDNFRGFAADPEGNLYVAVARFAPEASLVVFKLDPDGNLLWQQRDDGFGFAAELKLDEAGNCFVAGTVDSGIDPRSFLVKYAPDGRKLWERRYGPARYPYWGSAISLAIDQAGNAFVVGFEFTVSKFDPEGNELWRKEYFGQSAYWVRVDGDGNAIVTGTRLEADMLTVKLNPDGRELWHVIYSHPGANWTEPCDLSFDARNNIFLASRSEGGHNQLTKFNSAGKALWRKQESADEFALFSKLAVDRHGHSWLLFTAREKAVLAAYDDDGKRLSRRALSHLKDGAAWSSDLLLDRMGNPVVTFAAEPNDVFGWITMKLPKSGHIDFIRRDDD